MRQRLGTTSPVAAMAVSGAHIAQGQSASEAPAPQPSAPADVNSANNPLTPKIPALATSRCSTSRSFP